jgi:hypothetical protein
MTIDWCEWCEDQLASGALVVVFPGTKEVVKRSSNAEDWPRLCSWCGRRADGKPFAHPIDEGALTGEMMFVPDTGDGWEIQWAKRSSP